MPEYTAAWTDESTGTWDLITAEAGHFDGSDPDAHVVAEFRSSAPVPGEFPDDEYLTERGWISVPDSVWRETDSAFYRTVEPNGIIECRTCGRRSDDEARP